MSAAPAPEAQSTEPRVDLTVNGSHVTLLGTAHVSQASVAEVERLLGEGAYDACAVELCPSRYQNLTDPEALARMDLIQVIRQGKVPMVTASLALSAYQQRLTEHLGIEPGAEMKAAIAGAKERDLPVLLIDREVGVTLRRIYRSVPWWERLYLMSGLFASLLASDKVSKDEIEALKSGDMLEETFAQFAETSKRLYRPLIAERDEYMAAKLRAAVADGGYDRVLAVVGAGHLKGLAEALSAPGGEPPGQTIDRLDRQPPPSRWPKVLPWAIVALILTGFAIGFSRSGELGFALVRDWVLINGTLAALGALIAGAHPLTVISAFIAAPLTSLNPMVGAGMVTALVETLLHRPSVADFGRLRQDVAHLGGWWSNRVTRIFLVFMLSSLGSVAGTYIAGFRIIEQLFGGGG